MISEMITGWFQKLTLIGVVGYERSVETVGLTLKVYESIMTKNYDIVKGSFGLLKKIANHIIGSKLYI